MKDANGIILATVHCRDDLQKWSFGQPGKPITKKGSPRRKEADKRPE
jgi:hypothetical protein